MIILFKKLKDKIYYFFLNRRLEKAIKKRIKYINKFIFGELSLDDSPEVLEKIYNIKCLINSLILSEDEYDQVFGTFLFKNYDSYLEELYRKKSWIIASKIEIKNGETIFKP